MERYAEYKDSGVEWIGEIPVGWDVVPLWAVEKVVAGATPKNDEANWGGNISWIGPADYADDSHYVSVGGRFITEKGLASCGTQLVPAGSVILSNRAPIGRVAIAENELCTNQGCKCLVRCDSGACQEYLYWYLLVQSGPMNMLGRGTTFIELSAFDLAHFKLPFPPPNEQQAIAAWLDEKTGEVDGLVADTERSIELLEEYRRSVISEAVTKGLDPSAPMKDSGIEWIGEIPSGWDLSKVKYAFINRDSERIPIESSQRGQIEGGLYPYYGASGIVDSIDEYIFDETLILIGEDGANLRMRSLPLIYVATGKYWVNNHAHILQPRDGIDLSYAAYQLELIDLEDYLTGSTQPKLTQENLGRIPMAVPPLAEQQAIAAHLDEATAAIDALIADKRAYAERLREYRKSLISEAVTGKFKVQGVG